MLDLTFFDTAAVLIPVLLLGGAIANRLAPAKDRPRGRGVPWILGVAAFFFLPAIAEVYAIEAALTDDPSALQGWVVVIAVAFGTWALAAAISWPWLERMWEERLG